MSAAAAAGAGVTNNINPFYRLGVSVLNNAKSPADGGLVGYVLSQLDPVNMGDVKSLLPQQVKSTVLQNGFLCAMIFGCVWTLVLLLAGLCLAVMHCLRKRNSKVITIYKQVARQAQQKRQRLDGNGICMTLQFALGALIVLFMLTVFGLHTKSLMDVRYALEHEQGPVAVQPRLQSALNTLRIFLADFTHNTRQSTAPIVEEMIQYTLEMQKNSSLVFNSALQERIGGKRSKLLGDKVTHFLLTMWDASLQFDGSLSYLFHTEMDKLKTHWKLFLNQSATASVTVPTRFREWQWNPQEVDLQYGFAVTYLFIMRSQNRTREKILSDAQFSEIKSREKLAESKRKMDERVNLPELLRSSSDETWRKMDAAMPSIMQKLDDAESKLHTSVAAMLRKASRMFALVIGLCLVIVAICIVTTSGVLVHYHCIVGQFNNRLRNVLKMWTYTLLLLLALPMLLCMVLFVVNGYLEDDICRFVRVRDIQHSLQAGQLPQLDVKINDFLDTNWDAIVKKMEDPKKSKEPAMPLPKVRSVFTGIVQHCSANQPILQALQAVESLDTSKLAKPEVSQMLLRIGRELMVESLNSTNPLEMMAPGTLENVNKLSDLKMFQYQNFTRERDSLEKHSLFLQISNNMALQELYAFNGSLGEEHTLLKKYLQDVIISLEHTIAYQNRAVEWLHKLSELEPIDEIASELKEALPFLVDQLNNKTSLLAIGNELFTKWVEKPAAVNSAAMMAKFGPLMMGQIAPCRPIFDIYTELTEAVCSDVNYPLTGVWLFMGLSCLLCTFLLVFLLTLLSKKLIHSTPKLHSNPYDSSPGRLELKSVSHDKGDEALLNSKSGADPYI